MAARGSDALKMIREQNGLSFQPDPLEAPEGSYTIANNVWANREKLIESRRGMERYGAAAAAEIETLFEYRDRIHSHDTAGNIRYDSNGTGTMSTHSGTFSRPETGVRMRTCGARKQNFLTTSLGVYSQDTLTQAPSRSGIEAFLELTITNAGDGDPAGPLAADSVTGYRCIFGREDENGRILRGTPSQQVWATSEVLVSTYTSSGTTVTVTTPSAHGYSTGDTVYVSGASDSDMDGFQGTITVGSSTTFTFTHTGTPSPGTGDLTVGMYLNASIEFPLPDDVVAGDFYEVYRTQPSGSDTTSPGEEHYLVKQEVVTSGDISTGTVTFVDSYPSDLLDLSTPLYTNPSLGSTSRSNDRPPYAVDLAYFKGHMHYAAAKWEEEREIILKSVTGLVSGTSTIAFGAETYTFESAESVGDLEFQLSTGGTVAENLRDTMKSLVRVINRGSSLFYAFYTSGSEGAPGRVLVRHRLLNQASFDLVADNTTTGGLFEPLVPTAADTLMSEAAGGDHILAISKFEQPEAVPRISTTPVGTELRRIERVVKLRDVVVILKHLDGFWVETGQSDGTVGDSFSIKERDRSLHIYGRDTACAIQNRVICYSNQGFVSCDEGGAEIIGREVEEEVERIEATTDWDSLAFAFAYESEDMYVCFGPEAAGDTYPTLAWVYNVLGGRFTNGFEKDCTAGHVLGHDDKYYLAHAVDDFILQERKALTVDGSDYLDEGISCTVTATSTTTNAAGDIVSLITVSYAYTGATLAEGFRLEQGNYKVNVAGVTDLGSGSYELELRQHVAGYANGAATLYIPIYVELKSVPIYGRGAAFLKQFTEVHFEFESDRAFDHYVAFETDLSPSHSYPTNPLSTLPPNAGWGSSPWGGAWGDPGDVAATPLIVAVDPDHARARRFHFLYKHNSAGEKVSLAQISVPVREISLRSSYKVSS